MADIIDIDEILDRRGNKRRLGSLPTPEGFVSSFAPLVSKVMPWDRADIERVCRASDRYISRQRFDSKWIQNQQSHGSCNGFAAAAVLARTRYNQGTATQDGLKLSGAYIYSKINGGQDRGSMLDDGMVAVQKWGAPPESLVPWDQIYPREQPANADTEAAKHKGLECFALGTKDELDTALAAKYFVIAAVHVGSRFDDLRNGICGVDNGIGNHAVCIDDYGLRNGTWCYDMANSWGVQFGDQGRGYLTWDHFAQTFNKHAFYAVPSIQESP